MSVVESSITDWVFIFFIVVMLLGILVPAMVSRMKKDEKGWALYVEGLLLVVCVGTLVVGVLDIVNIQTQKETLKEKKEEWSVKRALKVDEIELVRGDDGQVEVTYGESDELGITHVHTAEVSEESIKEHGGEGYKVRYREYEEEIKEKYEDFSWNRFEYEVFVPSDRVEK